MKTRSLQLALFEIQDTKINGVDGTFKNAKSEPFHSWFPYLEGYSASFVDSIRSRFLPNARRIIDPFAGTGTSLIVLGGHGIACGYCEANPVMRFVVETKLTALALGSPSRRDVAEKLRHVAHALSGVLDHKRAADLEGTYGECFGTSTFFEPEAFDLVLRLRTFCDQLTSDNKLLGELVTLAVIANLVRCSLLKRAGDVRFRTPKELQKGIPPLRDEVAESLFSMANDLLCKTRIVEPARLLAANAKDLRNASSFEADGVITSPPYLNGTNYIRNTKLELWFLRALNDDADLRMLRDTVITSGINDVTVATTEIGVTPAVEAVVSQIKGAAYDQRIHRMVAGYFHDMRIVLEGLWYQCIPGAVICIDIGDSRYAGVNVPTQDLLEDIAASIGFEVQERVPLRTRLSKDKTQLSQDVLVFHRPIARRSKPEKPSWEGRWREFKETLPHQESPYTKRNWGNPLHSLCSYQGKMKPSLAHHLVACFTEPGDAVIDPFSGAGTIPFEAALAGRRAYGLDLSVLATAVSVGKLRPTTKQPIERLLRELADWLVENAPCQTEIDAVDSIRFNRSIREYFHDDTLREILAARRFFIERRDDSPEWALALSCMLHILHGNRPYALSRRSHPITPFAPTGEYEYRPVLPRLRDKVTRSLQAELPSSFIPGACWQADILAPWPQDIPPLDAIITSPPFFDSTRFYMANWMRFWFCGWDLSHFTSEPAKFVETAQKKSLSVYTPIFQAFHKHLKPNGRVVLHLGASKKCDMAQELAAIAKPHFTVADIFQEDVGHCEKHGVSDKGTVTSHQYLVLLRD